mmetsp:Transcript_40120/g.98777  ORF Transcript_40120/g.98777 Transcript_40120/m.98777 type:complete len:251 (+) Transcript_40120:19-771(+)
MSDGDAPVAVHEPPSAMEQLARMQQSGDFAPPEEDSRVFDFVRRRYDALKAENKSMKQRVQELQHTLSIIQTAQSWAQTNGMNPDESQKLKEITVLLVQAKQAREEAMNFTKQGKAATFEQIRELKLAIRKERQEKRDMKERLANAFEAARSIREDSKTLQEKHQREREGWQALVRQIKERHASDITLLRQQMSETVHQSSDRMKQMNDFGSRVMKELTVLQEHLTEVKEETAAGIGGLNTIDESIFVPP